MDFCTKAKEKTAQLLAKDIGKHIEAEELSNAEDEKAL
jgi:hypothetical protein